MFSTDDSIDFDDQDFFGAAFNQHDTTGACSAKKKRKSFELLPSSAKVITNNITETDTKRSAKNIFTKNDPLGLNTLLQSKTNTVSVNTVKIGETNIGLNRQNVTSVKQDTEFTVNKSIIQDTECFSQEFEEDNFGLDDNVLSSALDLLNTPEDQAEQGLNKNNQVLKVSQEKQSKPISTALISIRKERGAENCLQADKSAVVSEINIPKISPVNNTYQSASKAANKENRIDLVNKNDAQGIKQSASKAYKDNRIDLENKNDAQGIKHITSAENKTNNAENKINKETLFEGTQNSDDLDLDFSLEQSPDWNPVSSARIITASQDVNADVLKLRTHVSANQNLKDFSSSRALDSKYIDNDNIHTLKTFPDSVIQTITEPRYNAAKTSVTSTPILRTPSFNRINSSINTDTTPLMTPNMVDKVLSNAKHLPGPRVSGFSDNIPNVITPKQQVTSNINQTPNMTLNLMDKLNPAKQMLEKRLADFSENMDNVTTPKPQFNSPYQTGNSNMPNMDNVSTPKPQFNSPYPTGNSNMPITRRSVQSHSMTNPCVVNDIPTGSNSMRTPTSSRTGTSVGSGSKRKRKFPGPAGVLPKLKPGMSLNDVNMLKPVSPSVNRQRNRVLENNDVPCSQSFEDRFQEDPWVNMEKDLEPKAKDLLNEFCISAVLKKASKKLLPKGKVPVICVMVDQLTVQNNDASVVLRDPSGEMKGTIHRQLLKDYPVELAVGTVLVLRQCGVFSPTPRSHYLNITRNNVVRVYYKSNNGEASQETVANFSEDDFVIPDPVIAPPQSPNVTRSHMLGNQSIVSGNNSNRLPFSVVGNNTVRSWTPQNNLPMTPRMPSDNNNRQMQSPRYQFKSPVTPSFANSRPPSFRASTPSVLTTPSGLGSSDASSVNNFNQNRGNANSGVMNSYQNNNSNVNQPNQNTYKGYPNAQKSGLQSTRTGNSDVPSIRPIDTCNVNNNSEFLMRRPNGVMANSRSSDNGDELSSKLKTDIRETIVSTSESITSLDFSIQDDNLDDLLTELDEEMMINM